MGANRDSLSAKAFENSTRARGRSGGARGSSSSLDSTLPPTPLRDLLIADGATIYILSADDELIHAVEQAAGDQYPIHIVDDWDELVDAAERQRAHIALLDADALPTDLPDAVAELHDVARVLVVLVAATSEESRSLTGLLTERTIHRLLIKPPAEGITRLLIESAIARYLQIRDQHEPPPPVVVVDDDDLRVPPRRYRKPRSSRSPWLLMFGLAAVVAGAAFVAELQGFRWRDRVDGLIATVSDRLSASSPDEPRISFPPEGSPSADSIDSIDAPSSESDRASAARSASPDPAGDAGPPDLDAAPSVSRPPIVPLQSSESGVEPSGGSSAGERSAVRGLAEGGAVVAAGDAMRPDIAPPELDEPQLGAREPREPQSAPDASGEPRGGSIARTDDRQGRPATPEAEPSGPDREAERRPVTEVDRLFDRVYARLADGRVLEPDQDSAMTYFRRAVELAPIDPRVVSARSAIAAALVDAAETALARGDLDEAQYLSREAFRLGAEVAALTRLDRELDEARREQELARDRQRLFAAQGLLRERRLLDANGEQGALSRLAALRRAGSTVPGLDETWQELTGAIEENVRASIDAGDFATAKRWAATLAIDGGDARLASELEFEATQAEFLATTIPASQLELIDAPAPVYPPDARASRVEGWVDLEFVVDRNGRPRDVVVVDSRPGERFVDAALAAVAGHRYRPFELNGRIYERRASLRVRFTLR